MVASIALHGQSGVANLLRLLPVTAEWDLPLNNSITATPAFRGARGYFPIEGDRLAAYDVLHGTLLWIAPIRTRWQPATGHDLIFVAEADAISALKVETGVVAWRMMLDSEPSAPPVWDNEWLVVALESGDLLAYRARDGALIWRQTIGARVHSPPALAADRIYLPLEDNRVVALQVERGERVWERRLGGVPNEILALDDRIFVGSNDDRFYSIAARDGHVLWNWPTGADVVGLPAVDAQRVYFVSFDNMLRALDRNTGNQRWKRPLPIRPTRGPVMVDDVLFVSGVAEGVRAFLRKDGSPAGAALVEGELAAAPYIVTEGAKPLMLLVTRDLEKGTILRAVVRVLEGESDLRPLPNLVIPAAPTPRPTS